MPLDPTDDKSILVQVMAWCRQATSHYLSQRWPRCLSPYGVTRPQWVNSSLSEPCELRSHHFFSHLPWTRWPPCWKTTFSNPFSWMKMLALRFTEIWYLGYNWLANIGSGSAPSHYLKQCWPSLPTHICGTRGIRFTATSPMETIYNKNIGHDSNDTPTHQLLKENREANCRHFTHVIVM